MPVPLGYGNFSVVFTIQRYKGVLKMVGGKVEGKGMGRDLVMYLPPKGRPPPPPNGSRGLPLWVFGHPRG